MYFSQYYLYSTFDTWIELEQHCILFIVMYYSTFSQQIIMTLVIFSIWVRSYNPYIEIRISGNSFMAGTLKTRAKQEPKYMLAPGK